MLQSPHHPRSPPLGSLHIKGGCMLQVIWAGFTVVTQAAPLLRLLPLRAGTQTGWQPKAAKQPPLPRSSTKSALVKSQPA